MLSALITWYPLLKASRVTSSSVLQTLIALQLHWGAVLEPLWVQEAVPARHSLALVCGDCRCGLATKATVSTWGLRPSAQPLGLGTGPGPLQLERTTALVPIPSQLLSHSTGGGLGGGAGRGHWKERQAHQGEVEEGALRPDWSRGPSFCPCQC